MTAPTQPFSHSCQSCGAATEYAPGTRALRCSYCGQEEALPAASRHVQEHSYDELLAKPRKPAHEIARQHFVCQKCGAHLQGDAVSQRCQFCTAPLVVDTASDKQIAPEAVVPFDLDRSQAREVLRAWVKSRWFAPNRLKKVTEAESMNSTYLPHWTFDAATASSYTGQRGDYYYVTEHYTVYVDGKAQSRTRRVRKTRWSSASGRVSRRFDDVLVAATSRVPADKLDKVSTWQLGAAEPFQPGYVAGHESLRYEVEPEHGLQRAKDKMAPVIRSDCRQDIGGDEQRVHTVDTTYSDITYKLLLLPAWVGSYLYNGKTWHVLINGCSGHIAGDRPFSPVKITLTILTAIALIAAIIVAYELGAFT